MKDFAVWLRKARRDAGLSRLQLARLTGISIDLLEEFEDGSEGPSASQRETIQRAIGKHNG